MLKLISEFLDAPASSEADHRIANHLSLIASLVRLQTRALSESKSFSREDAVWLLDDCGQRIEIVARVHRLLAAQTDHHARIDIHDYLHDVAESIVESTAVRGKFVLKSACDHGCLIRADHIDSLGFLVGELVTNAVKYAHPAGVGGAITMLCSGASDNSTIVTVSDDGVGLPEGFDPATNGNIGFRMIRSLVQRLQGEIAFDSSPLGLKVTLRIPNSEGLHAVDSGQAASGANL